MADEYSGLAIATFEFDLMVPCLVAADAAAKTADIKIEAVERNRLVAGVCVKMRGQLSELRAALDAALRAGEEAGGKHLAHTLIPAPTEGTDLAARMTIYK